MTIEQAIRLLDPKTTKDAIAEIEYKAGFNGKAESVKAVEEACKLACEIMRDHQTTEKAYQMAIDDDIKVTMENKRLKEEIERLRKLA